jgi:hypothetical protein
MTLTISEATCALPKILSINWREKALRSPAQVSTSILLSGEDFRTVQELSGGVARRLLGCLAAEPSVRLEKMEERITTEALARQRVEQSSRGVASG